MGSTYSSTVFRVPKKSYDKTWKYYIDIPMIIPTNSSCVSCYNAEEVSENVPAFYFKYPD